ncbi:MAG TPA: twin-arginine translocase subunit TatB [Candidatus Avipropionibacterium avicola]|uniref:Sec-independent protein translocase protein TatB n=1 Tax=Candidatus Avipropionibacterium avicola TaxID=2840701 RepID=A0A9D1KMB2_9ACTN|nr:twin-arginine translocase subunit TatB [Candidatus Avipropionibacterium avicola]
MPDVGLGEILVLAVIAIIVFGPERLPELARKAAHVLHYVRNLANQAQDQLKEELGPEFSNVDFKDLNPKQFIKKHLLDEVEPIVADVKSELKSGTDAIKDAGVEASKEFDMDSDSDEVERTADGELVHAPYDPEAT